MGRRDAADDSTAARLEKERPGDVTDRTASPRAISQPDRVFEELELADLDLEETLDEIAADLDQTENANTPRDQLIGIIYG